MQDLAVVPILFMVGALGAKSGGNIRVDLALALGKAVLTIGVIYATGKLLLRPLMRVVAHSRSPEMFMAAITASRIAARMERHSTTLVQQSSLAEISEIEGHVIVAGFGRVGRTVADILESKAIPSIAIDNDPVFVARARQEQLPILFGDATRLEMLNRAHIENAQAIVVTIDSAAAAGKIIREIRLTWPSVPIYARARDGAHAARLTEVGATLAVPETIEASLQLAGRVLQGASAA